MLRRFAIPACVIAAGLAAPGFATAEPPPDPAQTLFDQGLVDMENGRFEKACPAIEASQRLDPRPGTLFALAECESQRGRIATAVRYYAEYLALYRTFSAKKQAEQKGRAKISEAQVRSLDPLVPRLTLKLPAGTQSDVVVKRDGNVVAELSIGTAIRVDPGEHVVATQVPGGAKIEQRITLAPREARTLELTVQREPLAVPSALPSTSPSAQTSAPPNPPPSALPRANPAPRSLPPPDVRPWRIGTWAAGAAGIVGLAVGAVAGVLALEQRTVLDRSCAPKGGKEVCNDQGIEARDRLEVFGTASTIGFVAGGVSLGVGVALIVVTPTAPPPVPPVGGGQTALAPKQLLSLTVGGQF